MGKSKNEIDYEDGYDRKHDTESKILEEVASQLGEKKELTGGIFLYTDKRPCPSCMLVLKKFKEEYSNIKLIVYFKTVVNFEIKGVE